MADDSDKPVRFPVVVVVGNTRVEVILTLRPGTAVTVESTKTTAVTQERPVPKL
jgi:hypothetical protein